MHAKTPGGLGGPQRRMLVPKYATCFGYSIANSQCLSADNLKTELNRSSHKRADYAITRKLSFQTRNFEQKRASDAPGN